MDFHGVCKQIVCIYWCVSLSLRVREVLVSSSCRCVLRYCVCWSVKGLEVLRDVPESDKGKPSTSSRFLTAASGSSTWEKHISHTPCTHLEPMVWLHQNGYLTLMEVIPRSAAAWTLNWRSSRNTASWADTPSLCRQSWKILASGLLSPSLQDSTIWRGRGGRERERDTVKVEGNCACPLKVYLHSKDATVK